MKLVRVATLCLTLAAVPASAGSPSDTHKMLWAPSGKVPAMTFHPLKQTCGQAAAPLHLAGKMPLRSATGNDRLCTTTSVKKATNDLQRSAALSD